MSIMRLLRQPKDKELEQIGFEDFNITIPTCNDNEWFSIEITY